jgi:uncharacterized protein YbjT (DUF2867 family)
MRLAIAGAHGQVGSLLTSELAARRDHVIGLIRDPAQASDVRAAGATPLVCDLELATVDQVTDAVEGCELVVFAAGAGSGSGAARKLTMDRDGAITVLDASSGNSARYIMLSGIGVENPPQDDDIFSVYLRAKAAADAAVMASGRDWTIVRPGRLTDDPGTGLVNIESEPFGGEITRSDLAAFMAALVHDTRATRRVIYVNGGAVPIPEALEIALACS